MSSGNTNDICNTGDSTIFLQNIGSMSQDFNPLKKENLKNQYKIKLKLFTKIYKLYTCR